MEIQPTPSSDQNRDNSIGRLLEIAQIAIEQGNKTVASIALLGLANVAQMHKESADQYLNQAESHPLTELPNRRALDKADKKIPLRLAGANEENTSNRRKNEPNPPEGWVCLMVDLDDFKLINDVLGHDVGDDMLVTSGAILTKSKRSYDELYHFGGDEFALFMPIFKWHEATEAKPEQDVSSEEEWSPEKLDIKMRERFFRYARQIAANEGDIFIKDDFELSNDDREALGVLGASFAISFVKASDMPIDAQPTRKSLLAKADKIMAASKKQKNNR